MPIIIGIIIIALLVLFLWPILDICIDTKKILNDDLRHLHHGGLVILTVILIVVAWIQLKHIYETSRNDFLLRIEERYGCKSILEARRIIHTLYRKTCGNEVYNKSHGKTISERLKAMANKKNQTKTSYIYLAY